jgi:hypothetical protein
MSGQRPRSWGSLPHVDSRERWTEILAWLVTRESASRRTSFGLCSWAIPDEVTADLAVGSDQAGRWRLVNPMPRIVVRVVPPDRLNLPDDLEEVLQHAFRFRVDQHADFGLPRWDTLPKLSQLRWRPSTPQAAVVVLAVPPAWTSLDISIYRWGNATEQFQEWVRTVNAPSSGGRRPIPEKPIPPTASRQFDFRDGDFGVASRRD